MTHYAWKCVACSKSYRTRKTPSRQPSCPDCGQPLLAVARTAPIPMPHESGVRSLAGASSAASGSSALRRRSARPSDPQSAIALIAPSSAWVPDSEPGPSPDAAGFHTHPSSSRFSHAIPSPSLTPAPPYAAPAEASGKPFPWIWASVGGVALIVTLFVAFLAARSSGPKAALAAKPAPAQFATPAKAQLPAAAILPRPSPVTTVADPSIVASAESTATGRTINLMTLIDPARDAHTGNWKFRTSEFAPELISDAAQHARLNIAYEPPEEYDFRVDFTRVGGDNCMTQIFTHGKSCCLVLFGWKGTCSGFQQIDGQYANQNPTGVRNLTTDNGQRHTSIVKVRKDSLEAWLDGKLVTRYETDGSNTDAKDWAIDRPLGVGSQLSPTVFHTIELTEISGPGRALN